MVAPFLAGQALELAADAMEVVSVRARDAHDCCVTVRNQCSRYGRWDSLVRGYRYPDAPVARADCESESSSSCFVPGCPGLASASAQPVEVVEVVVEATEAPESWWHHQAVWEDREGLVVDSSARWDRLAAEAESRNCLASV